MTSLSDTPRLQYYDVQTLEYRYISKLPTKNKRIWSYVKETTSHLQNKLTKNIHLGVATRSSTKWDCFKPIRFHQYTWGLQHFLTFLQEDIAHIKCYWFKISLHHLPIFDSNHIPSCTSTGSVLQLSKVTIKFNEPISPYKTYFWVKVKLSPLPNFGQQPYSFMHICR